MIMASIELQQLSKQFGDVSVIRDLSLDIKDGEFIVVVGPSGCGKSTVLRLIAGLESPTKGQIKMNGSPIDHISPKDRDIAMVFQHYALYPHMSVSDNLAFSLKMRKADKKEIKAQVNRVADMLELTDYLNRKPKALSGGQRQRVALGRAIVRNPNVFLMDEPLSNLDAKLRVTMRREILELHQKLGVTTVYVTHDQEEALTMGDRIAVLKDGDLHQFDTPKTLYKYPVNQFVGNFIGQMNFIQATIAGSQLDCGDNTFLPKPSHVNGHDGDWVVIGIRPNEFSGTPTLGQATTVITPVLIEHLGHEQRLHFVWAGQPAVALVHQSVAVTSHHPVTLGINTAQLSYFDAITSKRIPEKVEATV